MQGFEAMMTGLAELFEEGGEDIASLAAMVLREHAAGPVAPAPRGLATSAQVAAIAAAPGGHRVAGLIAPLLADLDWHYSGYEDGRIDAAVAARMQTVEIVGPDGMIKEPRCRVGLFAMVPGVDYSVRTHAAEELFVQIAGEADWQQADRPYLKRGPGARMHHASYEPHATRTTARGMIAAWVWGGNIDYDTYRYGG